MSAAISWVSGGLLAAAGVALAAAWRSAGQGSDAAGRGMAKGYAAIAGLVWLVVAGLYLLGLALGSPWLQAIPLAGALLPLLFALVAAIGRLRFRTPLERAAHAGDAARVRELLAAGETIPGDGGDLLRVALHGRNARDVVPALLEAGASARDPELLLRAIFCPTASVADFFKHGADPNQAIFAALSQGRLDVVEAALAAGGNPNLKDAEGWPLLLAHASGRTGHGPGNWSFVRRLLALGADPAVPAPDGTLLRDLAARAGQSL